MNEKKSRLYLILAGLMTLIIWTNSVLPADISSNQSGFLVNIAQDFLSFFGIEADVDTLALIIRKCAHFVQFYILGILWFLSLSYLSIDYNLIKWYAFSICLITAVIDESIQLFSVGRAFQVTDILIDIFGSIMAISALAFAKYPKKIKDEPI